MKNICILWDFDNTLAYRDGMWTQSLCNVLKDNGYDDFDRVSISDFFKTGYPWHRHKEAHADYFNGMTWWEYINTLISNALRAIGITDEPEIKRLTHSFKDEYLKLDAWYVYDDTISNLEYSIKKGYKNVILSNHIPELEMIVEYLGISKYFIKVITSAKVGYEKPNRNFYKVVDELGDFDDFYMIGDNYNADILGALDYGISAIMVRKPNIGNYEKYSEYLDGIWEFID